MRVSLFAFASFVAAAAAAAVDAEPKFVKLSEIFVPIDVNATAIEKRQPGGVCKAPFEPESASGFRLTLCFPGDHLSGHQLARLRICQTAMGSLHPA